MDANGSLEDANGVSDLHPVELIAHSLLSGSLESLSENFDQLYQSQVILLTRLNLIEQKLNEMKLKEGDMDHVNMVSLDLQAVKSLRKRLSSVIKLLDKIDVRVAKIDEKLQQ